MGVAQMLMEGIAEERSQKHLAMSWLEHFVREYPRAESPSPATVESRLSEALKDKAQGIRFLFANELRIATTFAVFHVRPERQAELLRIARASSDNSAGGYRLIVDLSSGPTDRPADVDKMLASFRERFLGTDALWPMALVLTAAQYERLPRSFDDFGKRLHVQKVSDVAEARARTAELVDDSTIIAAPDLRGPFERWIAVEIEPSMQTSPENALSVITAHGELPGLPAVTRPLSRIARPDATALPAGGAIARRKLMLDLASGAEIRRSEYDDDGRWYDETSTLARRAAWAKHLGIEAAATPKEWLAALPARIEPARLMRKVSGSDLRWLAQYEHLSDVACEDGEGLLLVNPSDDVRAKVEDDASVAVLDVEPALRPKLEALMQRAAALTREDLDDDPYLMSLLEHGRALGIDTRMLQHAHAAWLWSDAFPIAEAPPIRLVARITAWLREICAADDLELGLRVVTADRRSCVIAQRFDEIVRGLEVAPHPRARLSARREDRLRAVTVVSSDDRPKLGADPEAWSGELLRPLLKRLEHDDHGESFLAGSSKTTALCDAMPSEEIWQEAERALSLVLLRLRAAVRDCSLTRMPSGRALLDLGGGVFAEIDLREHRSATEPCVELELSCGWIDGDRWTAGRLAWDAPCELVPIFEARSSGYERISSFIGPSLPRLMILSANGARAEIRFVGSGLHAGASPVSALAAVSEHAVAMNEARRDEERHRNDDD